MKSLESDGTNKYNVLKIRARLNPWNMESNNTKVTNLSIESKWLSKQTIIENTPEAAPDELERVAKEAKVAQDTQQQTAIAKQAAKSQRIATNNNSSIADNNKSSESNV